jgi:hypothetical protein
MLMLFGCQPASAPASQDTDNTNGTPSTYDFQASYDISSVDAFGKGHGSVYVDQDGYRTFAASILLDGTALSTAIPINNNLTAQSPGDSVALSVAVGGLTYTGSAILPSPLSSVTYAQNGALVPPSNGYISLTSAEALVISWNTTSLAYTPAKVRVEIVSLGPTTTYSDEVAFASGTLTIPANTITSGQFIYVYSDNEASNIAPTTQLDAAYTVFYVKNGTQVIME